MAEHTFRAGLEEFTFYFYGSWRERPPKVAVNVKYRGSYDVPPEYEEKLEQLEEELPHIRERVTQHAFENVQEMWWEETQARATELKLGKISGAGRCGGWLVTEYTVGIVNDWCDNVEFQCEHCGEDFDTHVDGKCLFDACRFEPRYPGDLNALRNLATFVKEVGESMTHIQSQLVEELCFRIDQEWEEFNGQADVSAG